jgi:pyruvate/2-oxoglutarate dehydrogenase complex dihydrolipoamide dehydrogenase (E3) component
MSEDLMKNFDLIIMGGGAGAFAAAYEILLAAGKTPNTKDIGLDVAGVEVDQRKAVALSFKKDISGTRGLK